MDNRSSKCRYSLVFAAIVSFLSVCTAGVSTFAWFQAQANVNVRAAQTSTTITVAGPKSVEVSNPVLYAFNGNGTHGYKTDTPDHSFAIGSEDDEYTEVTGSSISISKLWPGYKATFCIVTSTTNDTEIYQGSLKLSTYTATNKSNRKVLNANKNGLSGSAIAIETAINIYVGINGNGDYEVGSDSFNYQGSSLENRYLLQNASVESANIYCFYTIEFSSDPGTYYTEYVYKNSTYKVASEAQSDEGNRFFAADRDNGNSSCYEGLSFDVTSLALEMA